MSWENARHHWKALAGVAAVFILLFIGGPLAFYGLPILYSLVRDLNPGLLLVVIPVALVGWLVGAYWLLYRADKGSETLSPSENAAVFGDGDQ